MFSLLFVALVSVIVFFSAWAIAEGAVNDRASLTAKSTLTMDTVASYETYPDAGYNWREQLAVWICPLH